MNISVNNAEDKNYWLAFSVTPGIGPLRFQQLLSHFGSAEKAWFAEKEELIASKIGEKITERFLSFRKTFSIEAYFERMNKKSVGFVTLAEDTFPKLLKESHNPPFVLYVKGSRE